jgi:hypothetical protein
MEVYEKGPPGSMTFPALPPSLFSIRIPIG